MLFGVTLGGRRRPRKGFQPHAVIIDAPDGRKRLERTIHALRVEHLGYQATIGQRRRIAVAAMPSGTGSRELLLDCSEAHRDPVARPCGAALLVDPERRLEVR